MCKCNPLRRSPWCGVGDCVPPTSDQLLMSELKSQKRNLESLGYTVAYISIYGSQNYGLDICTSEYKSDIDTKAVIVPTLDDLVRNSKPVSTTIMTRNGQCDIKDIRTYLETLLKANPAYIETLFSKYHIIDDRFADEFKQILDMGEELVSVLKAQFVRAIYGMMCEKQKALKYPYPSIAHKIEKWGYDGKQAHHIYRLLLMMHNYYEKNFPLKECFRINDGKESAEKKLLIDLKLNAYQLAIVEPFVNDLMDSAKVLRDDILSRIDESKIDYSIKCKFLELSQTIIKNKIIVECGGFVE